MLHEKGRPGAPFFFVLVYGLAVAPARWLGVPAAVARGQRHFGLESLELDASARAGPQQPVGRLLEAKPALLRIGRQHRVERGKKGGDVAVDAAAQFLVERRAAVLARRRLIPRHLRRHLTGWPGFAHRREVAVALATVERGGARGRLKRRRRRPRLRGSVAVAVAVAKAEMQLRTGLTTITELGRRCGVHDRGL